MVEVVALILLSIVGVGFWKWAEAEGEASDRDFDEFVKQIELEEAYDNK